METNPTILDHDFTTNTVRRRQLLPWWIKTFSWLFMVMAGIVPFGLIASVIFGFRYEVAMYGLQTFEPLSIIGMVITLIILLKGIVGFGLWFEKDWAITIGQIDAIIGILICICVMAFFPFIEGLKQYSSNFRLEILFLIIFLVKLLRIKSQWMAE